jgi:solute carrier family 25 carnitine/acylcarnitine transporter 20/29
MQIEAGYANQNAFTIARKMYAEEGFRSFFRGCIPPLWGSMVYRGIMISTYEAGFTWLDAHFDADSAVKKEVLGLRPMVLGAAIFAAGCRSLFESERVIFYDALCSSCSLFLPLFIRCFRPNRVC